MGRRCLVTGGAGFIGSHLVERLLQAGHQVTVIDNFSTGRPENLAHLDSSKELQVHHLAVDDHAAVRPLFEGIEWVFHLAALADIIPSVERPLDYYTANVSGTMSVVEAARLSGVSRLVYAGSGSYYGIPDEYPTREGAAIQPEYPYALTKYLAEQIVVHWGQVYQLPALTLRLFNVFGPRSRTSGTYGAVFGVFLAQKLAGKPFTVVGDGTQTRDFTFVTDVARAFIMAAESDVIGEVFNIGSGNPHSVNDLVRLLGGDVVFVPKRPGEPDCTHAEISKSNQLLGWKPEVTFEEGVQTMLEHIDYWRQAPVWDPESISRATQEWFQHLEGGTAPDRY